MAYRKLGRNSSNRKALFRSILTSFFKYGRIETTVTKAKEVAKQSAQLITLAKRNDLHARRQVPVAAMLQKWLLSSSSNQRASKAGTYVPAFSFCPFVVK